MSEKDLNKNVKLVYLLNFLLYFLVIIPVIIPYYISIGLTMEQVFKLQATFGISMAIFEIPSGYMSDIWGRKNTIVLGTFVYAFSYLFFPFVGTFNEILIIQIFLGFSVSLKSGSDISILYDSIFLMKDKMKKNKLISIALSRLQLYQSISETIASILGGFLVTISFNAVLLTHSFFAFFPLIISLKIKEVPYKRLSEKNHLQNFKYIIKKIFYDDLLLRLIFINFILWSLSSFIVVWIFQRYWEQNNLPLIYFGVLWAFFNLLVGVTSTFSKKFELIFGPTILLALVGILPIAGYFGMSYFSGILGIVFGLCFQISRGINMVLLKEAFNERIDSSFRSTANSIYSFFFRISFSIMGPIVGIYTDKIGLNGTLRNLAYFFIVLFIIFTIPFLKNVKKLSIT